MVLKDKVVRISSEVFGRLKAIDYDIDVALRTLLDGRQIIINEYMAKDVVVGLLQGYKLDYSLIKLAVRDGLTEFKKENKW